MIMLVGFNELSSLPLIEWMLMTPGISSHGMGHLFSRWKLTFCLQTSLFHQKTLLMPLANILKWDTKVDDDNDDDNDGNKNNSLPPSNFPIALSQYFKVRRAETKVQDVFLRFCKHLLQVNTQIMRRDSLRLVQTFEKKCQHIFLSSILREGNHQTTQLHLVDISEQNYF